jgi:phosphoglycerate dehydrogenase-like enzyme
MTSSIVGDRESLENAGRVLVTAPGFDTEDEETGARLREAGLVVDNAGPRGSREPAEVANLVETATAAIVSSDPFTEAVFAAAPRLRVIARLGVGVDNIDLEAATRAGVVVTTTPGLNDETCADHALALLLAATRRIVEHDASVRRGEWDRGGELTPWDLHHKRVGVIGYGRIGRAVVRRLEGFGPEVRVFDPAARVPVELACPVLDELLAWADVVTLHVPLTPSTAGLIGPPELERMGPDAILVTTSRGGVVDEPALLDALRSQRLRAAGLDVFEREPPDIRLLAALPNLVLSPHIGGLSRESLQTMSRRCVQQVLEVLNGEIPEGAVDPALR